MIGVGGLGTESFLQGDITYDVFRHLADHDYLYGYKYC